MPSTAPLTGQQAAQLLGDRVAPLAKGLRPPVIGLNGAQGSGKSTMAKALGEALARERGLSQVTLSLDDFYLTKSERERLAYDIHPLCVTRGVPGTHDMPLMRDVLHALIEAGSASRIALPRFDKLADDREPLMDWPVFEGAPDVIVLEGWCVGVRQRDLGNWTRPINQLESDHDPDGKWFAWSFEALAAYEPLWDLFSRLFSIEVPDLETVIESRFLQEQGLTSASEREPMNRAGVERFVQHYERYTRALWAAMPSRADLLLRRDRDFTFTLIRSGRS